jgi:hypothetical protein
MPVKGCTLLTLPYLLLVAEEEVVLLSEIGRGYGIETNVEKTKV